LATLGGNAKPAIAGMAATAGAAFAIASTSTMGGAAHGGLDFVPKESTYLLDKGERVLSPRQNEDFTEFLGEGGGGRPVVYQVVLDGRELISWMHGQMRQGTLRVKPA
jgi:hypothetical protein